MRNFRSAMPVTIINSFFFFTLKRVFQGDGCMKMSIFKNSGIIYIQWFLAFLLHSFVSFDKSIQSYNQHHNKNTEQVHHSSKSPHTHLKSNPPLPSTPDNDWSVFSMYSFTSSWMPYKCYQGACSFWIWHLRFIQPFYQ